jgi:hypothetical protein
MESLKMNRSSTTHRRNGAGLEIEVTGQDSLYIPVGKWVSLDLVASDEFELATPRADRLHIDTAMRAVESSGVSATRGLKQDEPRV